MLFNAMHSGRLAAIFAAGCSLWFAPVLNAQNLIPNGSFEDLDDCPSELPVQGYSAPNRPYHWFRASGSPDYFNSCEDDQVSDPPITSVPHNFASFQYPQDGQAYSGMWTRLVDNGREMVGIQLTEPLQIGMTYYGSFWANAAFGGNSTVFVAGASNNIGILFTMALDEWMQYPIKDPPFGLRNFAHIKSDSVITDTIAWTLVSGNFVADSAYQYLVVGNHFDNDQLCYRPTGTRFYFAMVDTNPFMCLLITSV